MVARILAVFRLSRSSGHFVRTLSYFTRSFVIKSKGHNFSGCGDLHLDIYVLLNMLMSLADLLCAANRDSEARWEMTCTRSN